MVTVECDDGATHNDATLLDMGSPIFVSSAEVRLVQCDSCEWESKHRHGPSWSWQQLHLTGYLWSITLARFLFQEMVKVQVPDFRLSLSFYLQV